MTYNEFKNKVQNWPIVKSRDITLHQANKQVIRNQLERWHARKLLIKLKRGIFLLNPNDRKISPSRTYIANQLYTPSYVSLEYALNYYDLIPEQVRDLTSVTTRKTQRLRNEIGAFIYQHLKPAAFRGFKKIEDEAGLICFIAEPEKALVDFCYLNLKKFQENYRAIFEESYRLQNIEILNTDKIMSYGRLFKSDKLMRVSNALCELIKKEKRSK